MSSILIREIEERAGLFVKHVKVNRDEARSKLES
jgi:hypothetical protein